MLMCVLIFSLSPTQLINVICHQVPTREFRSLGVMHSDAYTLEEDRSNDPEKSLQVFLEEYPVLQLVGKAKRIPSNW